MSRTGAGGRSQPAASFGAILLLAVATGTGRAEERSSRVRLESVLLETNVWQLYPRRAEISLRTYRQLEDVPGVVLSLKTEVKDFSHYRYAFQRGALPAEAPRRSRDGEIVVRFEKKSIEPQRVRTVIQAVSTSGRLTRPYSIEIGFNPKEHYARAGQTSPGWLVVQNSDLVLSDTAVEDWIVERPSAEDRAYARKRWGALVKPHRTDYERARVLARALVQALHPSGGIPSDKMRSVSGLEQLARAEAGKDRVWCANYADIFSAAGNALDIPVRKVEMQYVWSSEGENRFEIAEGHRTTEMFDEILNGWVWMDLTFGVLGARENDRLLNLSELVHALDDGRRIERLHVVEYDPQAGAERAVPVLESRNRKALLNFFRKDQRYRYMRKAPAVAAGGAP